MPVPGQPAKLAFCPLLLKYRGKGYCSDTNCIECSYPYEEFGEDMMFLCSVCVEDMKVLPYWGEGECDICGWESCVLMMVKP